MPFPQMIIFWAANAYRDSGRRPLTYLFLRSEGLDFHFPTILIQQKLRVHLAPGEKTFGKELLVYIEAVLRKTIVSHVGHFNHRSVEGKCPRLRWHSC